MCIRDRNDIETYRDVLFYVGQVLGGFFCINRAGKLELRKYGNKPVMTVSDRHRFSSSFSDFITRYTAVSSTNLRTQTAEYYALEPVSYTHLDVYKRQVYGHGRVENRGHAGRH